MIFNTENTASVNMGAVMESPYALGIEGALMHVYENECNYNAMMKAIGVSELKYFKENGEDLFVNEAGALGSFLQKAKEFFKKVIEKIKMMFKKFFATINKFVMSDKDFVKKYEKELLRVNMKDFEFKGYTFNGLTGTADALTSNITKAVSQVKVDIDAIPAEPNYKDSEELDSDIASMRAAICGKTGEFTVSELTEALREDLYGDKDTLENVSIREQLNIVKNASDTIKKAEKVQKSVIKDIDKFIKECDKSISKISKFDETERTDDSVSKAKNGKIKNLNDAITMAKEVSNCATIVFGAIINAYKDQNRQAKAICVKALGYKPKNEAAYLNDSDDIFAGVTIR